MVEQSLQEGMMFELETTVDPSNIVGPELPVLSTPSMIRLMEHAALKGVAPYLPEGMTTVGTRLGISNTWQLLRRGSLCGLGHYC
jgi:predicted thioesterase